jgi:hypothetical protein
MNERLDVLDQEEFWDACHRLFPDMPRETFEADWQEFQKLKQERLARRAQH